MPMNSIFGVFADSPIKPIQSHIDKVAACSELLIPFFNAANQNDWDEAANIRLKISALEHEADDLKRELRLSLPKGLFMPVARGDLLSLVKTQDKIANTAKDISGRTLGRKLQIPTEIAPSFMTYLQRCLDAIKQSQKVINEFDALLETGFKGRNVGIVNKMIEELESIEGDTDKLQITLRCDLLAIENEYNPINVMFLYQIFDWVGELADLSELIGSQLELIIVRS